ncbi:MAG: class I SAM-dependent methyltransferase, partial [Cyanobacteria bacterium J06600_6]
MTLYNSIGKNYNATRRPDPRIVQQLLKLLDLPLGSMVADLGAGTGNYSRAIAEAGYQVVAIEPSSVMRQQAIPHPDVSWIAGAAEAIPLKDRSVDGVVVMLALHHFSNLAQGLKEINRIAKTGKMVLFAFEQKKIPDFWLADYFPYFIRDTLTTFPSTQEIAQVIEQISQKEVEIIPYLLPTNLSDLFAAS